MPVGKPRVFLLTANMRAGQGKPFCPNRQRFESVPTYRHGCIRRWESLVPQDLPLRAIRAVVNGALERLSPRFERICAQVGRPSIAPERLLRALLLQALFTIRSERQLMQQKGAVG